MAAMWIDEELQSMRLVAPDMDALLRPFGRRLMNPEPLSGDLLEVVEPLVRALAPVAPLATDDEAKALWLRVPTGTIDDFGSFEEMLETGEVESREEFEELWAYKYPEAISWYRLVVVWPKDCGGTPRFCGVSLGNKTIVSMRTGDSPLLEWYDPYAHACAVRLCELVLPALEESVSLLVAGTYNALVEEQLPYYFRRGLIRRSDLWEAVPDVREADWDGLSEATVKAFGELIRSGANSKDAISRMREFTANDFFGACALGYRSCGWECDGLTPKELYLRYADKRDEGLTGAGHCLDAGPGIDVDDPSAWQAWYFDRDRFGGHPWEVVCGGNSTHVDLFVMSDRRDLEFSLATGAITRDDFERRLANAGYYFRIAGTHRPFEAINFYVALSSAGLPVIIDKGRELLARLTGTDWVGGVPHHMHCRYCEGLFPDAYGPIIDFTHVFRDEDTWFDKVVWLPEEEAELMQG